MSHSKSWRPRLVALDIDGTVVGGGHGSSGAAEHEASPRVRRAVRAVAETGAHIALASGRSAHGMTQIADMLGLADVARASAGGVTLGVASNGSVIFSHPPLEVLQAETFDAEPAVRLILERVPHALVAVEEVGDGYRLNGHFPAGELNGTMRLQSLAQLVAEPVTRVIIRDPNSNEQEFLAIAADLGLHGINYFVGWTAWMDLSPLGVSKASGLEHVCSRLGVEAADVLAVGDGRNDVEMLKWAGRGVAMGQAPAEVREVADAVTGTVDDDGLALELERWV